MRPAAESRHGTTSRSRYRVSVGFTLLELLIVLAVVAMATAVVVPIAGRWLTAAQERAWRGDLKVRLLELPVMAFARGRPIELDADALRAFLPSFPAELELHLSAPLHYGATGVASGGIVEVYRPRERRPIARWQVEPVSGDVTP
ncbi:prepilin-type N-terminal cleavage/methylation domain-containing protein [Roseateles sp.]|uniref:prepilin-type N-terminal cleavage/methylation domain-containing protein n=1 Tax=Roseateles sp. TaxID=1971397 RepID=UPI003BAB2599